MSYDDLKIVIEQLQLACQEKDAQIDILINTSLDAVVVIDELGTIQLWNHIAEAIFGWRAEDAIGLKMAELIVPEEFRAAHHAGMKFYLDTEKHKILNRRIEIVGLHKSGHVFPIELTITPSISQAGRIFTAFIRDITSARQIQEDLIREKDKAQEANIAKSEFLANMSHEIRTPMNAVIGLSNILSLSSPLTEKQKKYIETLQSSADSLLSLIDGLLDMTRIESDTIELEKIPFDPVVLGREAINMLALKANEKKIELVFYSTNTTGHTYIGDPTRIRQIILNLCGNAIKFTESGLVRLILSSHADKPGYETLEIRVEDTGIGIPDKKLESIFEKFVQADTSITRKYGGSGLGLAITKALVELMGGEISVTSEIGVGSSFSIRLTLAVGDGVSPEEIDDNFLPISPDENFGEILVVEDQDANLLVVATYLSDWGYKFDIARTGVEAVDAVKKKNYSTILMDVQMPGMNGLQATIEIRNYENVNNLPHSKIIGMTAHALPDDRIKCILAGMDEYLAKPFDPRKLRNIL